MPRKRKRKPTRILPTILRIITGVLTVGTFAAGMSLHGSALAAAVPALLPLTLFLALFVNRAV